MSPHDVTRRAALGFVGAGSVIALAGCAASVRPVDAAASGSSSSSSSASSSSSSSSASTSASSSASSSGSSKNYSGVVKHEKFDKSAGEFEPATREQPAKNVPIPQMDDQAKENSVDGFYANISFISASVQYLLETGDDGPLQKTALSDSDKESFFKDNEGNNVMDAIKLKEMWFGNPTVTITLDTPQPTKSGDSYRWQGKTDIFYGEYVAASSGFTEDTPSSEQHIKASSMLRGTYTNGSWQINYLVGSSQ